MVTEDRSSESAARRKYGPIMFTAAVAATLIGTSTSTPDAYASPSPLLVSAAPDGSPGNGYSSYPAFSPDGQYLAYVSSSTNLVSGFSATQEDAYLRNLVTSTNVPVSANSAGQEANGTSYGPSVGQGGRYVLFGSYATNLGTANPDGNSHAYLRDMQNNTTTPVDAGAFSIIGQDSYEASNTIDGQAISADGRYYYNGWL